MYSLMTAHWGVPSPNLVVSVVGGREKVKPWVREVLRQGLVRAAQSTGEDNAHCLTYLFKISIIHIEMNGSSLFNIQE